ncbi:MAG: carboxypeptidase regulatory-like domain-containing protein [Planctomycetota bacterium]
MNERLALLLSLALGVLAAGALAWLASDGRESAGDAPAGGVETSGLPPSPPASDPSLAHKTPGLEGHTLEDALAVVHGQVVDDETNRPLAGVTVGAIPAWENGEPRRGVTDAEGRYEIAVPYGAYGLSTWLPGYMPLGLAEIAAGQEGGELWVQTAEDAPRAEAPTLRLRRGATLRVRVVDDATGTPVPQATVRLLGTGTRVLRLAAPQGSSSRAPDVEAQMWSEELRPSSGNVAELPTDERGELALAVLPSLLADWRIAAAAPGRISTWQGLAPAGGGGGVGGPARAPTLAGRVVDTSGATVPDVWIELQPRDQAAYGEWALTAQPSVSTDQGTFRIDTVPPGDGKLLARFADPDAPAGQADVLDVKSGEERTGIEIVVRTRHVLRATLVDEAGSPVRDGPLRIRATDVQEGVHPGMGYGRTNVRGHVGIPMPHAGPWTVELSTPLGWHELATGIVLPTPELTLRAPPEAVTSFTLRMSEADGTPIDWYRVSAFSVAGDSHRARTEHSFVASSSGAEMRLDVPGPLPLALAVTARVGETLDRRTMLLIVRELPADGLLQVTWSDATGFEGFVRDEGGRGIPNVTVHVGSAQTAAKAPAVKTDEHGRFHVPYSPDLDMVAQVSVSPPSPWLPTPTPWVRHDFAKGPMDVVLQRGATVVGRIETPHPVTFDERDRIGVLWVAGDDHLELRGRADAVVQPDGSFELLGVPHDRAVTWRYIGTTLAAQGLVFDGSQREVRAGEELILRTTRALTITGRLVGTNDLGGLQLRMREPDQAPTSRQVALDATGAFTIGGLRPATYELLVVSGSQGEIELARKRAQAGETDVQLHVPALVWLEIRLEPAAPRAACWVRETGGAAPTAPTLSSAEGLARVRVAGGRSYDVTVVASDPRLPHRTLVGHAAGLVGVPA